MVYVADTLDASISQETPRARPDPEADPLFRQLWMDGLPRVACLRAARLVEYLSLVFVGFRGFSQKPRRLQGFLRLFPKAEKTAAVLIVGDIFVWVFVAGGGPPLCWASETRPDHTRW